MFLQSSLKASIMQDVPYQPSASGPAVNRRQKQEPLLLLVLLSDMLVSRDASSWLGQSDTGAQQPIGSIAHA